MEGWASKRAGRQGGSGFSSTAGGWAAAGFGDGGLDGGRYGDGTLGGPIGTATAADAGERAKVLQAGCCREKEISDGRWQRRVTHVQLGGWRGLLGVEV